MTNTGNAETRMGTGPVWRLMLSLGIPTFVAQLINLLYNLVDRIYIGHIPGVGAAALTGVGLCMPVIQIISAFGAFAGSGGAPLSAIALGRGDRERAKGILGNSAALLVVFSCVLTVLFFFVKKPFLYLIGASDATWPYADEYLSVYLLGTLFVQLTLGLNSYITAQGQSRIAMVSVLIGAVTNIVLDPVFIFVFDMGVAGAAWATVLSQALSAAWVVLYLTRRASLRLDLRHMKPRAELLGAIAALGISPFIMQSTESLISIVLSSGLQTYGGDLYVGSLTILQSVMLLTFTPVNGFSQGVQPIMSYNFGAGNPDRVKAVFLRLLALSVGFSGVMGLSAMVFPRFYGGIFTGDQALIDLVGRVLPVFIAGTLIFGVQMACQTTFMALGQARISLLIALLRKVILLIPLALVLPRITGSVMGIYWAEPIADATAATICGLLFLNRFPRILRRGQRPEISQTEVRSDSADLRLRDR